MSVIKVPTSFNIDVEFEIPEFYKRLLALVIDTVFLIFYIKIASWIYSEIAQGTSIFDSDALYDLQWISLILVMPMFLYHGLFEIITNGQSLGKKLMKLRVVNENGGRASISQFVIRWLLRDIWFVSLFFMAIYYLESGNKALGLFLLLASLGYFITDVVLIVSSKKGQRLGDLLAHTIMISTNPKANIEETVFEEVADTYKPHFPQIMQLSDRDINAIKSILQTARKRDDFNMALTAADKIKTHLRIDTNMSPFDFLDILLKDYNYLSTK